MTEIERFRLAGWSKLIEEKLPLNKASVVWEFGGHLGHWSQKIVSKYGCSMHVFEPIPQFCSHLRQIFSQSQRVTIHPFGIGATAGLRYFRLNSDGTGEFARGERVAVAFESVDYLENLMGNTVDLAAINIEGGEYELVPLLASSGVLSRIRIIFIQFHVIDSMSDAVRQRNRCRELLRETHTEMWSFDFVWEAWAISENK